MGIRRIDPQPARSLPSRLPAALALALCLSASAGVATAQPTIVTVGAGADCDHASLQAALDAVAGQAEATVRVSRGQVHDAAPTLTTAGRIVVAGGFPSCSATQPVAETQVLGGFTGGPVLEISGGAGAEVTLRDLLLSQGVGSAAGGGLAIGGGIHVTLEHTTVNGNEAPDGGGIGLAGGRLTLSSSIVSSNLALGTAGSGGRGGGIHCSGAGFVELRRSSRILANSAAEGLGGGVSLSEGCRLTLISDRFDVPTAVADNRSRLGGGIWAEGGSTVVLSGDGHTPVSVSANRVESTSGDPLLGGGIALEGAGTSLLARNALIEDNVALAGEGGGLAVLDGAWARVERTLGPSTCHTADRCSRIGGNRAGLAAAVTAVGPGTRVEITCSYVEGNVASLLVLRARQGAELILDGAVVGENEAEILAFLEGQAHGRVVYSTVAANDLVSFVFFVQGGASLDLLSSIVFEPGTRVVSIGGAGTAFADCVLAHETVSVPAGRGIVAGSPVFVQAPEDYHLAAASPAVDFCDAAVAGPWEPDLDLAPRGADAARADRFPGARFDLGADETGGVEGLFRDDFESGDARAWSAAMPGAG